jgi:spermidine synthase
MLRESITDQYGSDCEIQILRRAPEFGAHIFVVDAPRGTRLLRTLGSIDREGRIMEQSAMDLLYPERLVFAYERLMLAAFALVPKPNTALLLGLGGGAMARHLAAYLPHCALTIVERDPVVRDLARRFFHLMRPVVMGDAGDIVAKSRGRFDVVLVDLYDVGGAADMGERFWAHCVAALRPGGCLAVNWAEFVGAREVRGEVERLAETAGRTFFLSERGLRPNVVQLAPTLKSFRLRDLQARLLRFAETHGLPREDRDILKHCHVLTR